MLDQSSLLKELPHPLEGEALNLTPDQCLCRLKAERVPKAGGGCQCEHRSNYSKQEVSGKEPFDDPYNYISVWEVLWLRRGASILLFLNSICLLRIARTISALFASLMHCFPHYLPSYLSVL